MEVLLVLIGVFVGVLLTFITLYLIGLGIKKESESLKNYSHSSCLDSNLPEIVDNVSGHYMFTVSEHEFDGNDFLLKGSVWGSIRIAQISYWIPGYVERLMPIEYRGQVLLADVSFGEHGELPPAYKPNTNSVVRVEVD